VRVDMNLTWVAAAAVVPLITGLLVAWPFWWTRASDEMGSVAGSAVVLLFTVTFIAREFGEVLAASAHCGTAGVACHFHPDPFMRYAVYGGVGMCQVFVVFIAGLSIEERLRRRQARRSAGGG
jgi:apolipoprotein N-acyltransferase